MSKFFKYFLLVSALFFSIFILFTSFNISSQAELVDAGNLKSRKFYVNKEILPDHSLYPLLMAVDRLRLSMADRERRIYLLMAYANRRLFYATRLLEKEELTLALTTFTKSQKYLNQALIEVKALKDENGHDPNFQQLMFLVLEGVDYQQEVLDQHLDTFSAIDCNALLTLSEETELLRTQLVQ